MAMSAPFQIEDESSSIPPALEDRRQMAYSRSYSVAVWLFGGGWEEEASEDSHSYGYASFDDE